MDFFIKCDQIRRVLQIWSHLLNKSLMENFILCAVIVSDVRTWISQSKTVSDTVPFVLLTYIEPVF